MADIILQFSPRISRSMSVTIDNSKGSSIYCSSHQGDDRSRYYMIDLLYPWIIFAWRLLWSWWHCSWWLINSYITIIMIMIFMVTLERITWLNNRWLVALCSGISVSLLSTTVLPSDRVEALQSLSCYAFSFYHMRSFLSHFRALPLLYSMIFICLIFQLLVFIILSKQTFNIQIFQVESIQFLSYPIETQFSILSQRLQK